MLKLSPMADIIMLRNRLSETQSGYNLLSTGIIGLKGEVKEILLLLGRETKEEQFYIVNCESPESLMSIPTKMPVPQFVADSDLSGFRYLLEPDALLLKTGAHTMANAFKLSPDCHIYLSDELMQGAIAQHFKIFEILELRPFDKNSIKLFGTKYSGAAVTAKALPLSSEELAKRLKINKTNSVNIHMFGVSTSQNRYLIACRKVSACD